MRRTATSMLSTVLCAGLLAGCAARSPHATAPENDPIEPVNRKIFWFNDKVDTYVLEPVAKGWNWVAPKPVQRSVSNFFLNIRFPIVAVNDLLQGKMRNSAVDVGRFGVNTTVGVLGFFDPATHWGLERHVEDFGQTLGVWGLGTGPYLVLPFLGPSSPRDTTGLVVDSGLSVAPFFVDGFVLLGATVVDTVNARAMILDEVHTAKESAFDYYSFIRNAYFQRRRALVADETGPEGQPAEDIYSIEPTR